jgi:hypothetical protein
MARRALTGALLALAAGLVGAGPAHAAPSDTIRTGGPSDTGDAKRAVVLSRRALAGRAFTVTNGAGRVVLRGRLRTAPGTAAPWRHAAVADLSRVRTPGTYAVHAGGRTAPRRWVVLGGGAAASRSVRHVLRFFAMNADGSEPSPTHGPSHLHDAIVRGGPLDGTRVDLTGGWMDAGDTMKFTGTTAYGVVSLLFAARLDPADAVALRASAGVGVRWLLKAHPAPGVFVSQVGDIAADHDRDPTLGFDPAADDASSIPAIADRPALTGIGLDSGGRTAAALALAAQAEPDPARRTLLLTEARAWYAAGKAAAALAPRLPQDPYRSRDGGDDMALGAVELYRAGGDPADLADALVWLNGVEPASPLSWDAVGPLAAAELCGAARAAAPSPQARSAGCAFLRKAAGFASRRARRGALATAGVLDFGTTAMHGGAGATLALSSTAGVASGPALAADARDWLLGRNAWGRSFVAGLGPLPPRHVHHPTAPRGPAAFSGGVVGGPTTRAVLHTQRIRYTGNAYDGPSGVYEDRGTDYVTSEPALDYASSAILLFAALGSR